jgi:hypothetical protein
MPVPVIAERNAGQDRLNLRTPEPFSVGNAGAVGDGLADDYNALFEAAKKQGTSGAIFLPPGTYAVGTSLTIACQVIFAFGAKLKPRTGVTVTLAGPVTTAPGEGIIAIGTDGTVNVTGVISSGATVDVRTFGAVGDGIADDSAAIQRAIDAAPAGGTVFFPRGTYLADRAYVITKSLTLRGESGSVIKLPDQSALYHIGSRQRWFTFRASGCQAVGLTFDGNSRNNYTISSTGRRVYATANTQGVTSLSFLGTLDAPIRDIVVTDCFFDDSSFSGLSIVREPGVYGFVVDGVVVANNRFRWGQRNSLTLMNTRNFTVTGNTFEDIFFTGIHAYLWCDGGTITGNTVRVGGTTTPWERGTPNFGGFPNFKPEGIAAGHPNRQRGTVNNVTITGNSVELPRWDEMFGVGVGTVGVVFVSAGPSVSSIGTATFTDSQDGVLFPGRVVRADGKRYVCEARVSPTVWTVLYDINFVDPDGEGDDSSAGDTVVPDGTSFTVETPYNMPAYRLLGGSLTAAVWATATTYAQGNQVTSAQQTFTCTVAHTSGASTEPGVGADWRTVWLLTDYGSGLVLSGNVSSEGWRGILAANVRHSTIADNTVSYPAEEGMRAGVRSCRIAGNTFTGVGQRQTAAKFSLVLIPAATNNSIVNNIFRQGDRVAVPLRAMRVDDGATGSLIADNDFRTSGSSGTVIQYNGASEAANTERNNIGWQEFGLTQSSISGLGRTTTTSQLARTRSVMGGTDNPTSILAGRIVDVSRRRNGTANIPSATATEVLRFTVNPVINSRQSLSASFECEFRFHTRRNDTAYMGSRVRLRFAVFRTLGQNTVLGTPTFADAVVSQEIGTNAEHTALDASQFALSIVSGSATEAQVVALSFTNTYNALVNNCETLLVGAMTCAGGLVAANEFVVVSPNGDA